MRLTPGQSRLAAVALAVLVMGLLFFGALFPAWSRYQNNREEIVQHRDHIERFSRIAANQSALERQVQQLERQLEANRYGLSQSTTTLAAAFLQERLKKTVEETGGSLASTRVLPPAEDGTFYRVAVNVRMRVTVEALQKVLYDLESGVPYLMVDNLVVLSRASRRRANRNRKNPRPVNNTLDVRFDLTGLMRARKAT